MFSRRRERKQLNCDSCRVLNFKVGRLLPSPDPLSSLVRRSPATPGKGGCALNWTLSVCFRCPLFPAL